MFIVCVFFLFCFLLILFCFAVSIALSFFLCLVHGVLGVYEVVQF